MRNAMKTRVLGAALAAAVFSLAAEGALARTADGKQVYESANCMGCHKWHGQGGGGYGGVALSLRETFLERDQLIEVIRCGRPETRMPYHGRFAWKKAAPCWDETFETMGDSVPPRPAKLLRDYQIEAVADYIMENLQGRGAPTKAECVVFWGEGARECERFGDN